MLGFSKWHIKNGDIFKIKSDVCKVKKGKLKIKKNNTLDCEIPLTVHYKKEDYSQTVKLELLYNGNVTLNFQPKYKKRNFLAWLFLGLLSGRDGLDTLDLGSELVCMT